MLFSIMLSCDCKFLSVAFFLSFGVQAAPRFLHRSHSVAHSFPLEAFHPETTFKTFDDSNLSSQTLFDSLDVVNSSVDAFQLIFSLGPGQVGYRSGFVRENQVFAYFHQLHNNIPFANAVGNIAWNDGKVITCASSFVSPSKMADSTPTLPVADIISVAEDTLGGRFNGIPPRLEYLVQRDGSVALVHVIQIVNEAVALFLEAFVDAHTGQLVSVIDFVAHDSYTVVPFNWASPLDGQKIINNPADPQISPGWHNLKALVNQAQFREDTTSGNNIFAYSGILQPAQETSEVDNFNTRYDLSIAPTEEPNVQAAIVNAFYVANTFHDLVYLYGFTEDAFNFQASDYGHGGKDGDPVFLSVQDPSGTNNANFATPPDGQPGICRMYLWTLTNSGRDGAMENSIVIHEMTHGLTNRLTGGGTGRCLQTLEAGGMGEGWSDAMADWVTQTSAPIQDFVLGTYVTNKTAGIRSHPYSANLSVNPLMYSKVASLTEVHAIGEVWANILHNVLFALVNALGLSDITDIDSPKGNVVFMHLFVDSLSLQPCNPTFVSARDAWIAADLARYGARHSCILYKAFASRGLGVNAAKYVNNFEVPQSCQEI